LKVAILATGGTIAGYGTDRLDYANYQGIHHIETLLEAIPESHSLAAIHLEQTENISSNEMTPNHWPFKKADRILSA
jgi:L-asparaginase